MTLVTYFGARRDTFHVTLATGNGTRPTPDGGPWACQFVIPDGERHRIAEIARTAEEILWRHLRAGVPDIFARAVELGWVPQEMNR